MREYPPLNEIMHKENPTWKPMVYNLKYLETLPLVPANGFVLCVKLAFGDPDRAVRNPDNLAFIVLGKSDNKFAKHR